MRFPSGDTARLETSSGSSVTRCASPPSIAIFQLGYRNRYRHPNPRVLDRYRERGIEILRSDAHAAISVHLRAGEPARVGRWRLDERRYWRIRLDGDED